MLPLPRRPWRRELCRALYMLRQDLLRLLTAGSVDDGKSTLIGRLLFDSKKLYEDQLRALERDSKRVGNAGEHIDYALLLDG